MNNTWIQQAFIYHLYPLGALGHTNSVPDDRKSGKITDLIPYLSQWKDMGINTLYLGPVFLSSTHGYDTIDYYRIDPRIGDTESMKSFVLALEQAGIRLVLDAVFNHVGRQHPAFLDVKKNKKSSAYLNWFVNINFNSDNAYHDGFSYEGWSGHIDLVKLNVDNPEVVKHLFEAVQYWVDNFNIDGLRLDAADQLSLSFLKQLHQFCQNLPKPLWLMGELLHGNYNEWVNDNMLDSCTNYEVYKGLYSSVNDKNMFEIAHSLNRQFGKNGIYEGKFLYNFLDNHDVPRIASILKDERDLYPLHIFLMTMPGIPSIYYESEFGVYGEKAKNSDDALRPAIGSQIKNHPDLFFAIKKLASIRKSWTSLQLGNYRQVYLGHEQFAFFREYQHQKAIIIINISPEEQVIDIGATGPYGDIKPHIEKDAVFGTWTDVLNNDETIRLSENESKVQLFPKWGRILIRENY